MHERTQVNRTQMVSAAMADDPSPAFILLSRILIGLIALLLLIIPWSERCNTLDSFPHSHDTELSLLAVFAFFGLVLLFVRAAKRRLRNLLAVRYMLFLLIPLAVSLTSHRCHGLALSEPGPPALSASSLELYNLPLQI